MGKIIGEAGDFLKERAIRRRLNIGLVMFILMVVIFFFLGFVTAKTNVWLSLIAVIIAIPSFKIFGRYMESQIRLAKTDESGALGEKEIACYLKRLPDTYTVINDLHFADSYGNIDHVVIGPTGVFAIDVKNWRGTVSADGKGELLLNGKPTDKPEIKNFTRRAMELRNRIQALTKLETYIQCVFIFPHTQLETKWGATGHVHCVNADKMEDYITQSRSAPPISARDIPRLVSAIEALKNI